MNTTQFGVLANATLKELDDPGSRHLLPPDMWDRFLELKIIRTQSRKESERLFKADFAKTRQQLMNAEKFVFEDDFSRLVQEAADYDPNHLLQLVHTARPPFEPCWIEWSRAPQDYAGFDSWGMLITRRPDLFNEDQYEIMVVVRRQDKTAYILPGTLCVTFREQGVILLGPGPAETFDARKFLLAPKEHPRRLVETPLNVWYCDKWKINDKTSRFWEPAVELANRGIYSLGFGPYGAAYLTAFKKTGWASSLFSSPAYIVMSVYREVIAGLALVATHIDGAPLTTTTTTKTGRAFYGGRYHPALEYRILNLVRPMTAPLVFRAARRAALGPRPHHTVSGHWRHELTINAICSKHPFVCPNANWQPTTPKGHYKKVEEKHGDIQACTLCQRRRHHVRNHFRGDASAGTVVKDYRVTANKRRRT